MYARRLHNIRIRLDSSSGPAVSSLATAYCLATVAAPDYEVCRLGPCKGTVPRPTGMTDSMTIDACDLRLLYQGYDPAVSSSDYDAIRWRLGLLTPNE